MKLYSGYHHVSIASFHNAQPWSAGIHFHRSRSMVGVHEMSLEQLLQLQSPPKSKLRTFTEAHLHQSRNISPDGRRTQSLNAANSDTQLENADNDPVYFLPTPDTSSPAATNARQQSAALSPNRYTCMHQVQERLQRAQELAESLLKCSHGGAAPPSAVLQRASRSCAHAYNALFCEDNPSIGARLGNSRAQSCFSANEVPQGATVSTESLQCKQQQQHGTRIDSASSTRLQETTSTVRDLINGVHVDGTSAKRKLLLSTEDGSIPQHLTFTHERNRREEDAQTSAASCERSGKDDDVRNGYVKSTDRTKASATNSGAYVTSVSKRDVQQQTEDEALSCSRHHHYHVHVYLHACPRCDTAEARFVHENE